MRIITPLVFGATLAIVPFSVSAWEHAMERGVDLYQTSDPVMVLSLVCDPNSVYGTTVSAVLVGVGSNLEMNAIATFRFPISSRSKQRLIMVASQNLQTKVALGNHCWRDLGRIAP